MHKPTRVRQQGRTLDVVTQHLAVALGAALAQALAALAAPGHGVHACCLDRVVKVSGGNVFGSLQVLLASVSHFVAKLCLASNLTSLLAV